MTDMTGNTMIAAVTRLAEPTPLDAGWRQPPWRDLPALALLHHMGDPPRHFPRTEAKIAYDTHALSVMFRVADRYVRAVATRHQDSVCGDSCVEFFFTPGSDVTMGYFNMEINCGGTMLLHFNTADERGKIKPHREELAVIATAHSLPRLIEPEIDMPVSWTAAFSLPFALLQKYCRLNPPQTGDLWRGNFYKCADQTSHPHWLTWAPVTHHRPNFHLPQFFGLLHFQ